jgi:transcriptional regulator with XRE-family HTH domain
MKEKYMRFGDFIRKRRLADPRKPSMQDVADNLGLSFSYISAVESCNKRPFDGEKLEQLAAYLDFSAEDTALMFDIASRENNGVPFDIEDIFLHEEVGELARQALRLSKAGLIKEEDWKTFIRQIEEKSK